MGILDKVTTVFSGGSAVVYKWLAIGGIILSLCVGSFFYGKHLGDLTSKEEIAVYTQKRDQQALDLLGVNLQTADKIVTVYDTKVKVIHDTAKETANIATNIVPDREYFSRGWVRTYNASTTGSVPDATGASDGHPSTVKANEGLAIITDNNATCLIYKQRAESLIDFAREQQKNIDAANKKAK